MHQGVLDEEVEALDFAHNVLGLAEAEADESQDLPRSGAMLPGGLESKVYLYLYIYVIYVLYIELFYVM